MACTEWVWSVRVSVSGSLRVRGSILPDASGKCYPDHRIPAWGERIEEGLMAAYEDMWSDNKGMKVTRCLLSTLCHL